jgi:hypothetical protein
MIVDSDRGRREGIEWKVVAKRGKGNTITSVPSSKAQKSILCL